MELYKVLNGTLQSTYSLELYIFLIVFFSELSEYILVFIYKVLCLSSDCLRLRLVHRHRPNAGPFM